MKRHCLGLFSLASSLPLALAMGTRPADAQTYRVTEIPPLGPLTVNPQGMNGLGHVVGTSVTSSGQYHPFLFDGIQTIDLDTIGADAAQAFAVNDLDQVVGLYIDDLRRACLWDGGSMTDLGAPAGTTSIAVDINNAGQIAGWFGDGIESDRAFLWEAGSMTVLPGPGGPYRATAINDSGTIVGLGRIPGGGVRALRWDNGVLAVIGPSVGDSMAFDIDSAGRIVGSWYLPPTYGKSSGVLWREDGTGVDLGILPGSGFSSALSISDDGTILGYALEQGTRQIPWIWRDGIMSRLDDHVAGPEKLRTESSAAVGPSGAITAFYRTSCFGSLTGALLTPDPSLGCRRGSVGVRAGIGECGPIDVVFVDGSAGDPVSRHVTVVASQPVTIHVALPPDTTSGLYALWIYDGESTGCEPVRFRSGSGIEHVLASADRCLPVANSVVPGSCPCPASDLFGLGAALGVTSKRVNATRAATVCVDGTVQFPRAPVDFQVTFPPGRYTVLSVLKDRHALAANVAVGNTVVVESVP